VRDDHLSLEFGPEKIVPGSRGLHSGMGREPVLVGAKAERSDVDADPGVVRVLEFILVEQVGVVR